MDGSSSTPHNLFLPLVLPITTVATNKKKTLEQKKKKQYTANDICNYNVV
jgi:hypothetical protein